jgi:DNA polymerase III alpha subunit
MKKYLLEKCQTKEETARVEKEYELFEKKNFIKVLQFLVYFVDTMRKHNIVWGVGRGSSVASFCLFLIGIHKINPLMYKIDYREFLR